MSLHRPVSGEGSSFRARDPSGNLQRSGAHGRWVRIRETMTGPDRGLRSATGLRASRQRPSSAPARPKNCPSRSWHRLLFSRRRFTGGLEPDPAACFRKTSGSRRSTRSRAEFGQQSGVAHICTDRCADRPGTPVPVHPRASRRPAGPACHTPGPSRGPKRRTTRFLVISPIEPASVTPRGCGTGSWSVPGRSPGSRGGDCRVVRS